MAFKEPCFGNTACHSVDKTSNTLMSSTSACIQRSPRRDVTAIVALKAPEKHPVLQDSYSSSSKRQRASLQPHPNLTALACFYRIPVDIWVPAREHVHAHVVEGGGHRRELRRDVHLDHPRPHPARRRHATALS